MTKFNVGDEIILTQEFCEHAKGKADVIDRVDASDDEFTYHLLRGGWVNDGCIEFARKKESTTNRRLTEAEAKIATLEAEVKALKDAGVTTNITVNADSQTFDHHVFARKLADALGVTRHPALTPNQRRADVIKRAQAYIENYDSRGGITGREGFRAPGSYRPICDAEFVINADKRTVVCLLRDQMHEGIHAKGIAKCAPDDVFNADIGKAIALGRALGVKVPEEFTDAVKPTEVVVGMRVRHNDTNITVKPPGRYNYVKTGDCAIDSPIVRLRNPIIIDDSDAVYS